MARIIGLTGGIAAGKSTVSAYLRELGYVVIDADQIVHDLQAKGGRLYGALVSAFGEAILDQAGELDRAKLSEQVFSDPRLREKLSVIQDQMIREELAERRQQISQAQEVFFMDIPLLFELHYEAWFDEIWLICVEEATQVSRLMARNGYTLDQARARIAAQMPLADKKQRASHLIDNGGELSSTYQQIQHLLASFSKKINRKARVV